MLLVTLKRIRGPLVTVIVIAMSVLVAWVGASAALARPASAQIPTDLSSLLQADYGVDERQQVIPPLDSAIIEQVQQEALRPTPAVDPPVQSFAPIFLIDEGNQDPLPLPTPDDTGDPAQPPGSEPDAGAATPTLPTSQTPEPTEAGPTPTDGPDNVDPAETDTQTPRPDHTAIPTDVIPTPTQKRPTATRPPSNTATPRATSTPWITVAPTSTQTPWITDVPPSTQTPWITVVPTSTQTRTPVTDVATATPLPPSDVEPTETPEPTQAPEPTQVPEPTQAPEPTQVVEPTPIAECSLMITRVRFDGDRVRIEIENRSSDGSEKLQEISLTWNPAYGNLIRIQFGGVDVFRDAVSPPSLSIDGLSGDLAAGQTEELRFEFESDGLGAPVAFSAAFNSGCVVQFAGSGPLVESGASSRAISAFGRATNGVAA